MMMTNLFGENLFDDFFDFRPLTFAAKERAPKAPVMKTDIKENEAGYELDIDLPGYKKEDVQAQLKDGYLTISAATSTEDSEKDNNGHYIRRERYTGSCQRAFYVGDQVTQDQIHAKFDNGILKVTVPKPQPKLPETENKYIAIEG